MLNITENSAQKYKNKLTIYDIEKYYCGNTDSLIGLEYERLSLDRKTLENATYEKLEKIIRHFCELTSWELVYDRDTIIGAKDNNGSSISLEPGSQLEISLSPKKDVLAIDNEINKISQMLDKIADIYDVVFLGYGISPVSSLSKINLLNKKRYLIMDEYLPNCFYGELSQKMMRQTAGIQVNIDYSDSCDAYFKLKILNLIMPFMMGLCANSPLENNVLSDKKSIRAHVWNYTGAERCNLFYKNIFNGFFAKNNIFKNYINAILDVPMIFIERANEIVEIKEHITFREFLKNGYQKYSATIEDYILHQSLCFPDVRLKKYIEIRNHDSSDISMALALCAFYKGIFKNDLKKILSKINYLKFDDIEKYNKEIILKGLDFKINSKIDGWRVIIDLFDISKSGLNTSEKAYLEPILKIIKLKKTKADLIIDYNIDNAYDLFEFLCE